MNSRIQIRSELLNNIAEGVETILAFFSTDHPDLAQCTKMAAESLIAEHNRLIKKAKSHGFTDRDIRDIEREALEELLREHVRSNDKEHWTDLTEAVEYFVGSDSLCEFRSKTPIRSLKLDSCSVVVEVQRVP